MRILVLLMILSCAAPKPAPAVHDFSMARIARIFDAAAVTLEPPANYLVTCKDSAVFSLCFTGTEYRVYQAVPGIDNTFEPTARSRAFEIELNR